MVLGVIPARGGSKGIPRKNIRTIAGRPLLAWTIEAAKRATSLDRWVVSTEDEEIARVAQSLGAEVLPRPFELAEDNTTTVELLQHIVRTTPGYDTVVLLQPTSPFRRAGLVDKCVRRFQEARADSLATGWDCTYTAYGSNNRPRQELNGFFYDDGSVYVMRTALLLEGERFGKNKIHFFTDREQNVEIDDEFDFWLAEQILKKHAP